MKPAFCQIPQELQSDMRRMYESGKTAKEIAEYFHCDQRTAMNFIRFNYSSRELGKRHKPRTIEQYRSSIQGWLNMSDISARMIHEQIKHMGYAGSLRTVQSYIAELKKEKDQL